MIATGRKNDFIFALIYGFESQLSAGKYEN